jgi:predicted house-cleaning noncanonical NTP pyrophosphatase (MazG superfamily)
VTEESAISIATEGEFVRLTIRQLNRKIMRFLTIEEAEELADGLKTAAMVIGVLKAMQPEEPQPETVQ